MKVFFIVFIEIIVLLIFVMTLTSGISTHTTTNVIVGTGVSTPPPPLKIEVLSNPLFENLVGGSTPPSCRKGGGEGAHYECQFDV